MISKTGGHLAAGLGTVELSISLHYTFDTPRDKIIWDIGHNVIRIRYSLGEKEIAYNKKIQRFQFFLKLMRANMTSLVPDIQAHQ